jgi:hypothetical protein
VYKALKTVLKERSGQASSKKDFMTTEAIRYPTQISDLKAAGVVCIAAGILCNYLLET